MNYRPSVEAALYVLQLRAGVAEARSANTFAHTVQLAVSPRNHSLLFLSTDSGQFRYLIEKSAMLPSSPRPPAHDFVKHFAKDDPVTKIKGLALVMAPSILYGVAVVLVAITALVVALVR